MCHFLVDVITIPKTGEHFRLLYDVKGRYTVHRIKEAEAKVGLFMPVVVFFKYIYIYIYPLSVS
jgi:membrane-bound metal-dependent hydrolase YbcI (DUF457 family)